MSDDKLNRQEAYAAIIEEILKHTPVDDSDKWNIKLGENKNVIMRIHIGSAIWRDESYNLVDLRFETAVYGYNEWKGKRNFEVKSSSLKYDKLFKEKIYPIIKLADEQLIKNNAKKRFERLKKRHILDEFNFLDLPRDVSIQIYPEAENEEELNHCNYSFYISRSNKKSNFSKEKMKKVLALVEELNKIIEENKE